MTSTIFKYPAYRVYQTPTSKPLVLFAAPAPEVGEWVGIPQRGRLDGGETVGFQRQENESRIRELAGFFTEPQNVVQNALLCALQDASKVAFVEDSEGSAFGTLQIDSSIDSDLSLLDLISRVIQHLEARVPSLSTQSIDPDRLAEVVKRASEVHQLVEEVTEETTDDDDDESTEPTDEGADAEETDSDVASVLLTEETQMVDFYQELKARADVLGRLAGDADLDELLGFSKDAMISYLQPVVLVDGQHRLRGAIKSAESAAESDAGRAAVREAVDSGTDPLDAQASVVASHARRLPVSLLLDDSPSEHVFQFVVVNQKATPMGKALLGTIVSTSLSRDELEPVAQRLRNAGIRLEDSQAVAYLTRAQSSPFRGVVQTGVIGDVSGHLQWNVLKGLSSIFRELKGGRLYHQTVDYAGKWRRRELSDSDLVAAGADEKEKFALWSAPDGPWRDIFIRFYTLVRTKFGDPDDPEAHNAWGQTSSNLFNKVSLTILAADYFQYLCDAKRTLDSVDDVDETFGEWLEEVNETYFARDWRLNGLKKDQGPVQKAWSTAWFEYRKDPERLPRVENYRPR